MFFGALRPELTELVEEAVVSALQKNRHPHRYPALVNVQLASEITGYKINSLYQMNHKGLIPCAVKVGGRLLFRTEELQEWVRQGGPCISKNSLK